MKTICRLFKQVLGNPRPKSLRKKHLCDTWGKTFTHLDNLNRHRWIHTGVKPYKCPRCNKHFSNKSVFNRHLKAHYKGAAERMFTCNTCGETFYNLAPYNAHIHTMHQQPATTTATCKRSTAKPVDASPAAAPAPAPAPTQNRPLPAAPAPTQAQNR